MNRLWRALGEVDGWFWRMWLFTTVFYAGLLFLGFIAGPRWFIVALIGIVVVWLLGTAHVYRWAKVATQIATDGWEKFLDGREELGEYAELGGTYEEYDDDDEEND